MLACTFFGHRDCPVAIKPALQKRIEELIHQGVDTFYVGNQGSFDAYVRSTLCQLKKQYPHIRYGVVLAYLPTARQTQQPDDDTMFPEGLENIHPKFAIDRRNRWMLKQADFVICYVSRGWGGAAQYVDAARRQGKTVICLE